MEYMSRFNDFFQILKAELEQLEMWSNRSTSIQYNSRNRKNFKQAKPGLNLPCIDLTMHKQLYFLRYAISAIEVDHNTRRAKELVEPTGDPPLYGSLLDFIFKDVGETSNRYSAGKAQKRFEDHIVTCFRAAVVLSRLNHLRDFIGINSFVSSSDKELPNNKVQTPRAEKDGKADTRIDELQAQQPNGCDFFFVEQACFLMLRYLRVLVDYTRPEVFQDVGFMFTIECDSMESQILVLEVVFVFQFFFSLSFE